LCAGTKNLKIVGLFPFGPMSSTVAAPDTNNDKEDYELTMKIPVEPANSRVLQPDFDRKLEIWGGEGWRNVDFRDTLHFPTVRIFECAN